MDKNFFNIAQSAVEIAVKHGIDMAEAYCVTSKELYIEVRNGVVETMKLAEDKGIGLRLIHNEKVGFAFSTELTLDGIKNLVIEAKSNADGVHKDNYNALPLPCDDYPSLELFDENIGNTLLEEKIGMALTMEEVAKKYDKRIKIIENSIYQDGESEVFIVNSKGIAVNYKGTYCGLYLALVASEGEDSQTGFALDYSLKYKKLDPVKIGQLAAKRAVRMLGAKAISSRNVPVVLDSYVASSFLGMLGAALTADAVQKGRSLFVNKIGSDIASDCITLIDDGRLQNGIASAPFDGEGVPTKRTVLIRNGRLESYLYNTYTALKDGVDSTGNGVRASYKSIPETGLTNFYIESGNISFDELIKDIENGLYITEVMGMHTANPISGDFSLGATGILIENGELTKPVRGIAIAGNIVDMLKSVDAVADDLVFYGNKGAPTIRISQMCISGT
ncbi:TldD/PmbA family protein [Peptococcaceae bacterium]|nr:TldD/PmbA family protein [Peptococcaceae bacterium]